MLLVAGALKGYAIEASDGRIGTVSDFLFDDRTWMMRWLVVDTGAWLTGRKVLIHPSAIGPADYVRERLPVSLTRAQVEASPDIQHDAPVSRQMERNLYGYYGWDPMWGGGSYFAGYPDIIGAPALLSPGYGGALGLATAQAGPQPDGDPDLRSAIAVIGYHIHATDGAIGHLENLLIEDTNWSVRYLIVDTKNWWPGQHVLVSPYAVREISWPDREIHTTLTRERIRASPAWNPLELVERSYEQRLHSHYGWPGYGW